MPASPQTPANAPIGHSRVNAISPSLSDGRLVAVRAALSAGDIASPALRLEP